MPSKSQLCFYVSTALFVVVCLGLLFAVHESILSAFVGVAMFFGVVAIISGVISYNLPIRRLLLALYGKNSDTPVMTVPLMGKAPERLIEMATAFDVRTASLVKRLRETLRMLNQHETLAQHAGDMMLRLDAKGKVLYASAASEPLLGLSPQEVKGRHLSTLMPRDQQTIQEALQKAWDADEPVSVRFRAREDASLWLEVSLRKADVDGEPQIVGIARDVTGRQRVEQELAKLAHSDPLTGLANRTLLMRQLAQMAGDTAGAILMLDLDKFKRINDVHGHEAGDHLLVMTANRLSQCVRGVDTVARLGGDEFVVLLPGAPKSAACAVADKIVKSLSTPFELDHGLVVSTSTSVGIAVYPEDSDDLEALLKRADGAMYKAKMEGGRRWRLYSTMQQGLTGDEELAGQVQAALLTGALQPVYSEIRKLNNSAPATLWGLSASMCWRHPKLGVVPVADIEGAAEKAGLGESLLKWQISGIPALKQPQNIVHLVALPIRLATDPFLVSKLTNWCADIALSPQQLVLVVSAATDEVIRGTDALRAAGFKVAFQGFGESAESLIALRKMSPYMALMAGAKPEAAEELAMCRGLIALSHAVGVLPLLSGINSPDQERVFRSDGADVLVQGLVYGTCLGPEAFITNF